MSVQVQQQAWKVAVVGSRAQRGRLLAVVRGLCSDEVTPAVVTGR
jgi:hypothetical protein